MNFFNAQKTNSFEIILKAVMTMAKIKASVSSDMIDARAHKT